MTDLNLTPSARMSPEEAFERALRDHNCLDDFQSLVHAGCPAVTLMERVLCIKIAHESQGRLHDDPGRISQPALRALTKKMRWVADKWDRLSRTAFGKEVLARAERVDVFGSRAEFFNLPQRLHSLARLSEDLHRGTKHRRRPLYDDCLAELTEWVKLSAHHYSDLRVSALVNWALGAVSYDETTLRVWRSEHKALCQRARVRLSRQR